MKRMLKVCQVKSTIGSTIRQQRTIRGLGLNKIGAKIELEDNAQNRGMITKVQHLVSVEVAK